MQTLTFTQKLLRQRSLLSSLIPLLALFVGLSASQQVQAQGVIFDDDAVSFNLKQTADPTVTQPSYAGDNPDAPYTTYPLLGTTNPVRPNPNLGTFDINQTGTSQLTFTGGSIAAEVFSSSRGGPYSLTNARLKYRTYLIGTTVARLPAYTNLLLGNPRPLPSFTPATLYDASTSVDLLSGLLSGGNYVFEVTFEADYKNGGGTVVTVQNPGNPFQASFTVTAPPVTPVGGTTTWISQASQDWGIAANWSNGVPTRFANAIIPEKTTSNTNTVTPVLTSSAPNVYEVLTITLNGTLNSNRALLRVGPTTGGATTGATLNVYGDLNIYGAGLLAPTIGAPGVANPTANSTIILAGGDQIVRGVLSIADLKIAGTGVKGIVNTVNINNTLVFAPGISAIMRTVTEIVNADGTSTFTLNTTQTASVQLNGSIASETSSVSSETNTAYVEGVTIAQRTIVGSTPTKPQIFGNIGLDISSNLDITTPVTITRTVGDPLNSPVFPGRTPSPIKRQYGVSGDVNNAPNVSTIVFHYLNSVNELNGNNNEADLAIFKATNNGPPYALVGGTPDPATKTVTRTNITAINTITLGSKSNPLPVTLTSFDAKRFGADAVVTWETATELNNKGYNVQVSTDGKEFRTLGFVACASPNSISTKSYSYTDIEKNKVGIRYYRLQQVDVDGKTATFTPRAISFDGKAVEEAIAAYPNPFNSADQLHFTLQSAAAGQGSITIIDMVGRIVSKQSVDFNAGSNDVLANRLSDFKAGLYTVHFVLPTGQVQNMKIQKQ